MSGERALTRPLRTYSRRHLQRHECGLCGQRLDRKARGECGAIYAETRALCERKRDEHNREEPKDAY